MSVNGKTFIGTIDITPTWLEILPSLLAVLDTSGRDVAKRELQRMAQLADLYVAHIKKAR